MNGVGDALPLLLTCLMKRLGINPVRRWGSGVYKITWKSSTGTEDTHLKQEIITQTRAKSGTREQFIQETLKPTQSEICPVRLCYTPMQTKSKSLWYLIGLNLAVIDRHTTSRRKTLIYRAEICARRFKKACRSMLIDG